MQKALLREMVLIALRSIRSNLLRTSLTIAVIGLGIMALISMTTATSSLEANSSVYEWMTWNSETYEGNFVNVPQRLQIPENIKEQLIVELYSK